MQIYKFSEPTDVNKCNPTQSGIVASFNGSLSNYLSIIINTLDRKMAFQCHCSQSRSVFVKALPVRRKNYTFYIQNK